MAIAGTLFLSMRGSTGATRITWPFQGPKVPPPSLLIYLAMSISLTIGSISTLCSIKFRYILHSLNRDIHHSRTSHKPLTHPSVHHLRKIFIYFAHQQSAPRIHAHQRQPTLTTTPRPTNGTSQKYPTLHFLILMISQHLYTTSGHVFPFLHTKQGTHLTIHQILTRYEHRIRALGITDDTVGAHLHLLQYSNTAVFPSLSLPQARFDDRYPRIAEPDGDVWFRSRRERRQWISKTRRS